MKSFQTPYTIANEVRLKRTQRTGSFLLVEGASDSRFYRRFIDHRQCTLVPAFNKENVVGAISELDRTNFLGALGIVDSDFDVLMGRNLTSTNLVQGDTSHDLETMLIRSPALEAVLHEYASPDKLEAFEEQRKISVRTWLLNSGQCLGYLRWYSAAKGINLSFHGLKFPHFIDTQTLDLDRAAMFDEIRNHSQNWAVTDAELVEAGWPQGRNDDPWHVCCGHDLVDLLTIGLRRAIGSQQQLSSEDVARALRLAYGDADFTDSVLSARILAWEASTKFKVVR